MSVIEQVELLEASAEAFDRGRSAEALRLATTVRVLLHDVGQSHSLLAQIGHKKLMRYLDTGVHDLVGWWTDGILVSIEAVHPDGSTSFYPVGVEDGLVRKRVVQGRMRYVPLGGSYEPEKCKDFDDWWTDPFISMDAFGEVKRSRRQVVLYLANKAGGAHIDPMLDEDLERFRRAGHGQWFGNDASDAGAQYPRSPMAHADGDALRSTMRQIAHEVLLSMENDSVLGRWLADHTKQ